MIMPTSAEIYKTLQQTEGWKDIERVLQQRINVASHELRQLNNTPERDIELKARIDEMDRMLNLPKTSTVLIELYARLKENDNVNPDERRDSGIARKPDGIADRTAGRRESAEW